MMCGVFERFERFVIDDGGQDLVEYALLASIFTVTGLLAIQSIQSKMNALWSNWSSMLASDSPKNLWIPKDPS